MNVDSLCGDIIRREGGYTNNPNDRGGPTKYGVTLTTLQRHTSGATIEDVKALTPALAIEIYKADYYYSPRINTLPEVLQPQLFDISINSGPKRAVEMLQSVLNMAGYECSVDGMVGPTTRQLSEEAVAVMGSYIHNAIVEYREYFYRELVANDPSQSVFLQGWLRRAQEFRVAVPDGTA